MTQKRYFYSDDLTLNTQVISCEPQDDGRFRVLLTDTLFHPQGGGQPSDQGTLGAARMLQALQEGDEIAHYTDRALPSGAVTVVVEATLRQLHSRYHSAGHLIACAGEPFGWRGYKANHRPGEGRIVFQPLAACQPVTAEALQQAVTALVAASLPRKLAEEQGRRLVSWGTLTPYACGGTHVAQTGEVGEVIIGKVKEKKGELTVQYALKA
ncbi:alanyl-tRNA editing protein [Candidatus Pantoea soli]|uniref:Alanyl-tRNA editing protein n=1 Tax=Candidatus Pantoea soli TaxID=3098669 RepID=A0A518XI04_9GAMM|nr:alanyl-tRNA editing protein [Pantoea soli]QDY43799.1 alanyl-tRNA editing protein [Pantoea soli]